MGEEETTQGEGGNQWTSLFKKYEIMMKLGINVHGAVGRMRQDGCDKAAIAAFEKKHNGLSLSFLDAMIISCDFA